MNFNSEIKTANELMKFIDESLDGVSIGCTVKERVFYGYYHLALEHYGGIIELVNVGLYASASALLRPQFEAVSRGLYFQEVATDKQLQLFLDGKFNPKLLTLAKGIEKSLNNKAKPMLNFYTKASELLHGFTHGSLEQLDRRYSANELVNNFSEKDKILILAIATTLAKIASACTALTSGNEELAKALIKR